MAYFTYFQKLLYSPSKGKNDYKLVPNIFAKSTFVKESLQNSNLIFEYSVKDGEKPEDIAFKMYNDSQKHWIILLANDIMDPQYDWVLGQSQFRDYINKKYSSANLQLDITETYPSNYTVGEIVYQGDSLEDSSSSATVVAYDSTNKILQIKFANEVFANSVNVSGVTSAQTHNIVGITYNNDGYEWSSNTTRHYAVTETKYNNYDQITTKNTYEVSAKDFNQTSHAVFDRNTLTTTEDSYELSDGTTLIVKKEIGPVTYYDHENDLNEAKRQIKIPRTEFAGTIEQQFKQLMGT
jgi:hypothetical protein